MANERKRPALSNEVITEVDQKFDNDSYSIEVHTFDAVPFAPSEVVKAAIESGDVTTRSEDIEFWLNKPGVDSYDDNKASKVYRQSVTSLGASSYKGALAIFGSDEVALLKAVSAAAARNEQQNVYIDMRNAAQGPEKALERTMKIAASMTPTQLAAYKVALAQQLAALEG